MRGETPAPSPLTLSELVNEYLGQHVAEANTIEALRNRLKLAVDGIPVKPRAKEREHSLGDVRVDRLDARTVGAREAATGGLGVARAQGAAAAAELRGASKSDDREMSPSSCRTLNRSEQVGLFEGARPEEVAGGLKVVGELSGAVAQFQTTLETLGTPGGELGDAFADADSCQELVRDR